jgi:peptide/nickel transport system permease protein
MTFLPVILLSDALVFLLLAIGLAGIWYVRQHEHLLLPWRRVARSRSAVASLVILSLFILVGLLDTLHYRSALLEKSNGETIYSPEVLSLLDKLVNPLRTKTEKTYSAPLALTLYAKESITDARGLVIRQYPRLQHAGLHLADATQWAHDVWRRGFTGGLAGLAAGLMIVLFAKYLSSIHGPPLRPFVVSILVISTVVGAVASLATEYHVFGTDKVGQDVLYLSLKSVRTGLIIGTVTTLITMPFALFLGIAAGYWRGWVDDVIQYLYTVLSSIPSVLLIAAAVLMMQVTIDTHPEWFNTSASRADLRLVFLCLILGVTSWTGLCRLLRGETLKLRELEFIQAARAFGVSSMHIIIRHIVPNVLHIVLISLVMDFSTLVLAEAVLSYVGVGVDPTMISFGTMINAARLELGRDPIVWWSLASAFGFMLLLVLSANLFADAVRDAFDPRLSTRVASE